jgi:hypothetical protein
MTDFLFYGDTERSAAMRHELPVSIGEKQPPPASVSPTSEAERE